MSKRQFLFTFSTLFFFALGFITHAFFFPGLFTQNIFLYTKKAIENKPTPPAVTNENKALTIVHYNEGYFNPQVVVVGKSYYLGVINMSDEELMTLTSNTPLLRTPRGYGKSEQHLVQLYDVGEYEVSSTLHPDQVLKVIVK